MNFKKKYSLYLLTLLFIISVITIVAHYYLVGFSIYSDGMGYYVYLRSFVFDGDIDFHNEFLYYNTSLSKISGIPRGDVLFPIVETKTGLANNVYSLGGAIMEIPAFLIAHMVAVMLNTFGFNILVDGYSWPYEIFISIGNVIYGILGLWLSYKILIRFFDEKKSLLSIITIALSTALIYYLTIHTSVVHMPAFFMATLFFYVWFNTRQKRNLLQWILLGIIASLMVMVRQTSAVFLIVLMFESFEKYYTSFKEKSIKIFKDTLLKNLVFAISFIVAFIPQFIVWKILFGSYITYSYGVSHVNFWKWFTPDIFGILLSPTVGGLKIPIFLLSILGLILFTLKKDRKIGLYFIIILAAQIYIFGAWLWAIGYHLRHFIEATLLLSFGYAYLLQQIEKRTSFTYGIIFSSILIIINFINILIFLFFT